MIRNPKQEGTDLFDCRPQTGLCPMGCNQCFYNRFTEEECRNCGGIGIVDGDGMAYECSACKGKGTIRKYASYVDINEPHIPTPEEVGDGIVRMNYGHDSNIERDEVIIAASKYRYFFFNTSIPNFDFPGPVVFTANPKEEEDIWVPNMDKKSFVKLLPAEQFEYLDKLMYVRLRVSPTNLEKIEHGVACWTAKQIPVVLTFMAYYDQTPPGTIKTNNLIYSWIEPEEVLLFSKIDKMKKTERLKPAYQWRIRHTNSYYCPTQQFKEYVLNRMKKFGRRLVTICGTTMSDWCRDCLNCETYYLQTKKHLIESGKMRLEEK